LLTLVKIKQERKICVFLVEQYFNFCLAADDIFYIMDRSVIVAEDSISVSRTTSCDSI